MKILVIGNGFDLAHYLPTKYSQFIGVLQAIEKLSKDKKEIDFNDLFSDLSISEPLFFDRTKELYAVDEIRFDLTVINAIEERLSGNVWYAYFKHHLAEIETWIDFETKIGEALKIFGDVFDMFEKYKNKNHVIDRCRFVGRDEEFKGLISNGYILDVLDFFKFIKITYHPSNRNNKGERIIDYVDFNESFFKKYKNIYELDYEKILSFLSEELSKFTDIFNFYLYGVVENIRPKKILANISQLIGLDIIFSFNYTSTFQNFYQSISHNTTVEFLHGKSKPSSKGLVLGIDEFPHKSLKDHKAYGFVKYYQKLVKGTDYLFLVENSQIKNAVDSANQFGNHGGDYPFLSIYLWGHSLDVSDRNYIEEIFSFNKSENVSRYVQVIIFYHDEQSRFSMLANLIHILDEKLVELWMKKRWLTFEKAPNILGLDDNA